MSDENEVVEPTQEEVQEQRQKPTLAEEHKELINKTFQALQDNGYNFWDAQQVTGLVIGAVNTEDSVKALTTATEIARLFQEANVDKVLASALLQIMADKVNQQINKLSLSNIQIEEE